MGNNKLVIMKRFSKNKYCKMVQLYGECEHEARSAAWLYQQCFLAGPHPSHKTILKVMKRLRETGCMTSWPWFGRQAKLRRQSENVLYTLTYPYSNTREISENYSFSKNRVWKILRKLGTLPYGTTPRLALLDGDAERLCTWYNIVINQIQVQPAFLVDTVWMYEANFSQR